MKSMNEINIKDMEKAQGGAGIDLLTGTPIVDPGFPVYNPVKDFPEPVNDILFGATNLNWR